MNIIILFLYLSCVAEIYLAQETITTTITNSEVDNFLLNSGYLDPNENNTRKDFKKALRLFQRENKLTVNGRITLEVKEFIQKETDRQFVLDYLKSFGYIQGTITPYKTIEAARQVQRNSGVLNITGIIDLETINFLKSKIHSFVEPPIIF